MGTKKVEPAKADDTDNTDDATNTKPEAVNAGRKSARKTSGFYSTSDPNVKRDIVPVTF